MFLEITLMDSLPPCAARACRSAKSILDEAFCPHPSQNAAGVQVSHPEVLGDEFTLPGSLRFAYEIIDDNYE